MFRPRIGQQLLMAFALGLILLPGVSWATTVVLQVPHDSINGSDGMGGRVASTSVVNTFSINNDGGAAPSTVYFGTLDLTNNDLIIESSSLSAAQTVFSNAVDMARSGYNFGDWLGTGITSSTVAADIAHGGPTRRATAIGVFLNTVNGNQVYSTWDGIAVDGNAVLVKYTFNGDTDLEGNTNGFGFSQVVQHFNQAGNWPQGDTNYDGFVDGFDFSQVVQAFSKQFNYPATVTFASPASAGGSLSVPEPGSCVLLVMGMVGALAGTRALRRKK